jgi:hypothetical protein
MLSAVLSACVGSLYDPHPYPAAGPFFEGWYTRIVSDQESTFGFLFGRVLPAATNLEPPIVVSLLRGGSKGSVDAVNCFPASSIVTVKGKAVSHAPDFRSASEFEWRSSAGSIIVDAHMTAVNLSCGSVQLSARIGPPRAWGQGGLGPAGALDALPLPLHWFVYSLGSRVESFEWRDAASNFTEVGTGWAHAEKNWGHAFPPAWTWAQAFEPQRGVAFAWSGGLLAPDIVAHLVGYRNEPAGISLNFHPPSAIGSATVDGCGGTATLRIKDLLANTTLEATVSTRPSSLSTCLLCPSTGGFVPMSVESYDATVHVRAWSHGRLVEDIVLRSGALEFGGGYLCASDNPCKRRT